MTTGAFFLRVSIPRYRVQTPVACELRDTDLQLRPRSSAQRGSTMLTVRPSRRKNRSADKTPALSLAE
jgi:hypothetical protein